ncbi:MAG: hypothetical protein KJ070_26375, partial [Verrucomicrobia bacterium]|nr:hypothetical protein [Verrucomicrobiota bacterium]
PVIIHASHTKYGYNNLCGLQLAYTGAADTDADGLPDGWERRCFNNLDQLATADVDADGLSNLREYQLGTDPTRADSNANGISDRNDFERVWIEDAAPQGGYQYAAGGDTWNWVSSWYDGSGWGGQVLYPHSGRSWDPRMHVSAKVLNALHEHYFNRSLAVIRPAVGDVLYAYVNLDSSFPPSEVMLQFYTVENNGIGSWEHRAYWGANTINLGVNGTASRYPMGALPTAGQWVRLEVPASVVGLEGRIIAGLRFTLYGGRAAWDSAGTIKPDHDGDALPDWWEWQHFGNLVEGPNGDYDEDGVTNLDEYEAGTDPNTIRFSTLFENLRVNSSSANGTVTVIRGVAAKLAVLVDNTDFAAASWATYDSSFIANLGSAEGPHEVWVGLKGRADASVPTWAGYVLTRDTTPPMIVITNPVVSTVFQPLLQLQGYSPEPLASLRYDVANAAGTLTGLEGYVVKQFVDPDTLEITTNWFDCVDIELTNGLNTITLYVTDDAGNMSTTVLNFDFALPTTPPTVVVYWPQDGQQISGDSFTVRGRSSDATASVSAEAVGGGETTVVEGIVERDGKFWIEDIPLASGENTVNLSVTDVAANTTMTTFTVVKSSVALTIDPVHESFLNQPYVTVTGTINVSDHKVWVNGVEATLNVDATWIAEEVPMTEGGTAVIQARAIPISDNGGNGTGGSGGAEATLENPGNPNSPQSKDDEADPEKPWELVLIHYHKALLETSDRHLDPGEEEPYKQKRWSTIRWDLNQPGLEDYNDCWGKASAGYYTWGDANWDKKGKGFAIEGVEAGAGVCGIRGDPDATYPINAWTAWPGEYCSVAVTRERSDEFHVWTDTRARAAKTLYELRTGGKAKSQRKSIFVLTATASSIRNPWWPEWEFYPDAVDVAPPNIIIGSLGALGSDSRLYKALPDNK